MIPHSSRMDFQYVIFLIHVLHMMYVLYLILFVWTRLLMRQVFRLPLYFYKLFVLYIFTLYILSCEC